MLAGRHTRNAASDVPGNKSKEEITRPGTCLDAVIGKGYI